jgi:hypothetical protein
MTTVRACRMRVTVPRSAFNETKCFVEANAYLTQHGRPEVNWQIE